MLTAVADTGPLNYLVQIEQLALLHALFRTLCIPHEVRSELGHPGSPARVQGWIRSSRHWLIVLPDTPGHQAGMDALDIGETAAIALALSISARLILMDDRAGAAVARRKGVEVVGTLGVLERGARHGLPDLESAVTRLRSTSFRCHPDLLEAVLTRHKARRANA